MDSVSLASTMLGLQQAGTEAQAAVVALKAIQEAQAQVVKIIAATSEGRGGQIDIFV